MLYFPSEVSFHKQTLALIKCTLFWGAGGSYCKREEAKPTSLFLPLNSTQAAISTTYQQARCVAAGGKGRWKQPWRKDFSWRHCDAVMGAGVDRQTALAAYLPVTTALCSQQHSGHGSPSHPFPPPPSSVSWALENFPQRLPQRSLTIS